MQIGIVGAGLMGATHAAAWAETPAVIAGVLSARADEAQKLADQYGARAYSSYEALLAAVDVVDICTPTHLHYEQVVAAARAGTPAVCEKPLARTLDQGRAMLAACRAAGTPLLVAHVVRFFPEYALAKAAVDAGQIGRPAVLRLHRGSFRPRKPEGNWFLDFDKSGGILLDMMIHDYDYARWIAGPVESVYARTISHSHADAPIDYGMTILRHASGALSHIAGAWAYPPPTFRTAIEIAGDGGLIQHESAQTAPIELLLGRSSDGGQEVGLPASPLAESPYTTQIKEFYHALNSGNPTRVSAEDGLAALQVALAALESARTGQPVSLEQLPEVSE
jgi:predicted dehydrogenase